MSYRGGRLEWRTEIANSAAWLQYFACLEGLFDVTRINSTKSARYVPKPDFLDDDLMAKSKRSKCSFQEISNCRNFYE